MVAPAGYEWCSTWGCRADWLDQWQTLIAGLAALLAAGVAAWIARGQLNAALAQVRVQKEEGEAQRADATRQTKGRRRSARASLLSALSEICSYAVASAEWLKAGYPDPVSGARREFPNERAEPFPPTALAILQQNLEFLDEGAVTDRIESILREAQVLDSRARSLHADRTADKSYIASCLQQAASIYARAESLFAYARKQSETVANFDLWERAFAAFNVMGVREGKFNEALRLARGARDRGDAPGEADEPEMEV